VVSKWRSCWYDDNLNKSYIGVKVAVIAAIICAIAMFATTTWAVSVALSPVHRVENSNQQPLSLMCIPSTSHALATIWRSDSIHQLHFTCKHDDKRKPPFSALALSTNRRATD
jgi:hypothetical protein